MADLITCVDPADPRLDDFRNLTTADRRPDRPGGKGFVIAEGTIVVRRLLASRYPVRALLGVPKRLEELAEDIAELPVPAYRTSAETMSEVVGFHLNRGVLAVGTRPVPPAATDVVAGARRLLVLEGVGDHENLGSIFRNAAAFGVDGVLLGPGCADPLYRRSVRVSMGHVLGVPFARLSDWPRALTWLAERGFLVAALTPRLAATPLRELAAPGSVALLLGSEGHGLTEAALDTAPVMVRIPMRDDVDSLNVAITAAVACYELQARTSFDR